MTRINWMRKLKWFAGGLLLFIGAAMLPALTGCVGIEGSAEVDTYVPGPDVVVFGGYDRFHHYDRDAGRRGAESRAAAHHGGGGRRR
jgi:hypothetical protein